ncbi:capsid protein [Faeces associated gemycircularvirus 2]|uniref:Capsid protein n=1 Tax=Faeces associated gemycircularvirus 2 TaxID=1391031 RepID=T1YQT9_9VIRU|nr:capsid protein [Faeces associated gemycircularvirus 2]AGU67666.1 capsid protein [Faeces associated gemycircularvirus 2]
MAYARSRAKRGTGRSKKRGGLRPRYRKKRPAYRKKGAMTKKRILNLTSTKKRNTMLQVANTSSVNGGPVTPGPGPYVVSDVNGSQYSVFMPTAQDLNDNNGAVNTISNQAQRTATTCFIKGFNERIRIQTSSGIPWFWRRICFRARNTTFFLYSTTDTPSSTTGPAYTETSNGMQRLYMNLTINQSGQTIGNILGVLFRGQTGIDWVDPQTASVDTTRVDLVFDKRYTIKSGNASGTVRDFNIWHRYGKNLVYDDDENGSTEATRYNSVNDKRGGGDLLIFDIFTPGTGAGTADLLQLTSTSTLYWHEK